MSTTVDGIDLARTDLGEWRARTTAIFQDFLRPQLILREAVGIGDLPRLHDGAALDAALAAVVPARDRAHG